MWKMRLSNILTPCRTPTNCPHLSSKTEGVGLFIGCRKKKKNFGHVLHWEESKDIPKKVCKDRNS
jgi:hypothetical protein